MRPSELLLLDVGDLATQPGVPWWVSAASVAGMLITATTPLAVRQWRIKRNPEPVDPDAPAPARGINATTAVVATVTETTQPHGMSGIQLTTMWKTVDQLADQLLSIRGELDQANQEIAALKRHDSQRQWAFDQAIAWGISATEPPPRAVPAFLIQFMSNPPSRP